MTTDYRQLTTFLKNLGIEQVRHTQKNYFAHLVAVYQLMRAYGEEDELCQAGMFHSIYGTERFQGFKLQASQRAHVESLIGRRAEHLAYWNCFMDRDSFDGLLTQTEESYSIRHRETDQSMQLNRQEYDDLCRVHLYDWLEQVPRSSLGWDYRRSAYRQMALRLGGKPLEAYDFTFTQEPTHKV
jgi:hypothetical protein